ncbi:MAG: TetR/AcrR family transcriptional regulator [Myxococcota bacterium]|jgi:AcrR family transcriptional regulator|nr:TetR/AcrR family transcriptional regulator [Myxococcota bacterium]
MGAAETREDLIDAAWELFAEHGYAGTSVQAIINRLQLSKGGFYHHFASKSALLEALAQRLAQRETSLLGSALSAADGDPALRVSLLLSVCRIWHPSLLEWTPQLAKALSRDDNQHIAQALEEARAKLLSALLERVLQSGASQGLFQLDEPQMSAHMLMLFSERAYTELLMRLVRGASIESLLSSSHAYIGGVERLLGTRQSLLPRVAAEHIAQIVEAAQRR